MTRKGAHQVIPLTEFNGAQDRPTRILGSKTRDSRESIRLIPGADAKPPLSQHTAVPVAHLVV